MIDDVEIRAVLEADLDLMAPAIATVHENEGGEPPPVGTPYQACEMIPATPRNPEQGRFAQLSGIFSVILAYPVGKGAGDAGRRAKAIRERFWRGRSLSDHGVTVTIENTPDVRPGFTDGGRWKVPVSIPYRADVTA